MNTKSPFVEMFMDFGKLVMPNELAFPRLAVTQSLNHQDTGRDAPSDVHAA